MRIWDGVVEVFLPFCRPRGSSIAKRAEVMQSQDKTRHQLITHATCNVRITYSTKAPAWVVTASLFLRS